MRYIIRKIVLLIFSRIYFQKIVFRIFQRIYCSFTGNKPVGSKEWLIHSEVKYGGFISNIKINKVSSKDARNKKKIETRGNLGGDRMLINGFGRIYSKYLSQYFNYDEPLTLIEVGILLGTGLAIWCDLFPNARVIGLDIDLGHINSNLANLYRLGAFQNNKPELYEFDQFENNEFLLKTILRGDKINIIIDDGVHQDNAILTTIRSVKPHIAKNFLYVIEDNYRVASSISNLYSDWEVNSFGSLTVIYPKLINY